MSLNLIDLFQKTIGNELAKKASTLIGESEENTTKAMGGAIPGLLGGLLTRASQGNGASEIFDFLKNQDALGGLIDNVGGAFGGESNSKLLDQGGNILGMLFKDNHMLDTILGSLTNSGISRNSGSSLLKLAAPFLLGLIRKQIFSRGLDLSAFTSLLSSQKDHIRSASPQLFDSLGLASISGLGEGFGDKIQDSAQDIKQTTQDIIEDAGDAIKSSADNITAKTKSAAHTVSDTVKSTAQTADRKLDQAAESGSNPMKKLFPLILLGLAALAAIFLIRKCSGKVGDVTDSVVDKTEELAKSAGEAVDDAATTVKNAFTSIKLPSGKEISIEAGSFMDNFVQVLNGDLDWDLNDAFVAEGINFETGSARLTAESQEIVGNLAAAMEAYPNVEIRLEGHTDNTGDAAGNKSLSEQRALSVKKSISDLGISSDRITAEGFGQEKPVVANDSDENRAINRRVEVYITKK